MTLTATTVILPADLADLLAHLCCVNNVNPDFQRAASTNTGQTLICATDTYAQVMTDLRALDPALVQTQLDAHLGDQEGLHTQLNLGLTPGPHPSPLRLHDRGFTAWTEQHDMETYCLTWCWAPTETAARAALGAAWQEQPGTPGWDAVQTAARCYPGAILTDSLHPARAASASVHRYPAWTAAFAAASAAGQDDQVVSVRLG